MAGPLPPLQSSKARFTNPGIPLVSEFRGGESDTVREIPPEWRAALDLHVTEQSIPFDQNLFELTDEILASKVERTFTSEKKIRTTRKPAGVFTLLEKFTNKDKEYGTRTRNFRFIDDYPAELAVPSATTDVSTRNFGNKHFEEIVETIPGIFDAEAFTVKRPVVTPEDFTALLQEHEHCVTEEGQAVEPTLVAGDISRTDTQQDLFLHRECREYIDLSSLPRSIVNKKTNQRKQVETVTRILEADSTTPAVPTALLDVDFTKLGDGDALEIRTAVPSLFTELSFDRSIPDVTPEWAKALIQTKTQETNVTGTAADPTLLAGDLSRSEKQYDVFNKRTSRTFRDLTGLPKQRIGYKTNKYKQIETVTDIFEDDGATPAVPTALRDVTFELLGDGNAVEQRVDVDDVFSQQVYEESRPEVWPERFRALVPLSVERHREAGIAAQPSLTVGDVRKSEQQEDEFVKLVETAIRDLPMLPTSTLYGQRYEDTFDLVVPYSEWVDTAGANLGDPRKVVTPQGDGTEQVEQLDFTSVAAALDAYSLVFPGTTNLSNKLPDVLTDLASVFEVNSGNGTYSETGAGYWTIRGSYSLSIRGSGNGSAAVVADATFLLLPPFKPAAPTSRVVFFLPNPVTSAAVLTKLSAILSTTVLAWPAFDPKPVTVVCTSRKVSVRAEANQHTQSGGSGIVSEDGDPCEDFDCVTCDASSTTGTGTSTEVGITIKTIRIPPCLHAAINLHDDQDEVATAQAYAYDGSSWGSCIPPEFGPADTGVIDLTATGNVDSDASATSLTSYPSGDFLVDTSAQPYKYGYAMIHAEVVTL